MSLEIKFADILLEDVDIIVNPANKFMAHGGGLARAMMDAAGQQVELESELQAPVGTGRAIITTAGDLPHKAIIHTVGPIWDDGDSNEHALLRKAYQNALELVVLADCHSVAFPAVSCGIYRFPVEQAAPIAVKAILDFLEDHSDITVRICLLDDDHFRAFVQAVDDAVEGDVVV